MAAPPPVVLAACQQASSSGTTLYGTTMVFATALAGTPAVPGRPSVATPLPPAVRTLGVVSLLTDLSSEMIYPLLPSFLVGTLKAGPGIIASLAAEPASTHAG